MRGCTPRSGYTIEAQHSAQILRCIDAAVQRAELIAIASNVYISKRAQLSRNVVVLARANRRRSKQGVIPTSRRDEHWRPNAEAVPISWRCQETAKRREPHRRHDTFEVEIKDEIAYN